MCPEAGGRITHFFVPFPALGSQGFPGFKKDAKMGPQAPKMTFRGPPGMKKGAQSFPKRTPRSPEFNLHSFPYWRNPPSKIRDSDDPLLTQIVPDTLCSNNFSQANAFQTIGPTFGVKRWRVLAAGTWIYNSYTNPIKFQ